MTWRAPWILAALFAASPLAPVAVGEEPKAGQVPVVPTVPPEAREVGWHLVKPGETLEGITQHYLGTWQLWRENWKLNPDLRDPHRLLPGQRLRVYVGRRLPPRSALTRRVERKVESRPQVMDWIPAKVGDLLGEGDSMRTFTRSSAELGFDDGSRLVLTEDSLAFLKVIGHNLRGVKRQAIEVVDGQADLSGSDFRKKPSDIEIVVSGVVARPEPGPQGSLSTRTRRRPDGKAQLMVYVGQSAVESAGRKVVLPSGTGTVVPPGQPPEPPERLLPAPRPVPGAAEWAVSNPRLRWAAVEGAATYTVEVCRDEACGSLVQRATAVTGEAFTATALPVGKLLWRVTAVSRAGLDGFPSPPQPLEVTSELEDREPPVVAAYPIGAAILGRPNEVIWPKGGALVLAAADDAAGVETISWRWDGGAWKSASGRTTTLAAPGGTRLELRSSDRVGHVTEGRILDVRSAAEPVDVDPGPPRQ